MNVSRNKLRSMLIALGAEPWAANMIIRCTGRKLVGTERKLRSVKGIAMGSPISPLLWNLYAVSLLEQHPGILLHGYADNFWLQARTLKRLGKARKVFDRVLGGQGLKGRWDKDATDLTKDAYRVMDWKVHPVSTETGTKWHHRQVSRSLLRRGKREGLAAGEPTGVVGAAVPLSSPVDGEGVPLASPSTGEGSLLPVPVQASPTDQSVSEEVRDDEGHDRHAANGDCCPRNRTDAGRGSSPPRQPGDRYRAASGALEVEGSGSTILPGGGAAPSAVPGWYADKDTIRAWATTLPDRPVLNLAHLPSLCCTVVQGHNHEAVLRRWWQQVSGALRTLAVSEVEVRVPREAPWMLDVGDALGAPRTFGPAPSGDHRWRREDEFLQADVVILRLRKLRETRPSRPLFSGPGTTASVFTEKVGQHHRCSAFAVTLAARHTAHGLRHPTTVVGPVVAHARSPLAAEAAAIASILRDVRDEDGITVLTSKPQIIDGLSQDPKRASRAGNVRPGEMREALLRLVAAAEHTSSKVRVRRIRSGGRAHEVATRLAAAVARGSLVQR